VGGAVAWPLAARAQQPATPVIGLLYFGWPDAKMAAAFHKGLNETGYFEGHNVAIETRSAQGDASRLPDLAADLVRRQVAVIATPSGTSALAAKAATTTIPIVFSTAGDPAQMGLVANLNRPDNNVTGVTSLQMEATAKRFGFLHELLPKAARFAVLINSNSRNTKSEIADAEAAASAIRLQMDVLTAGTSSEIDTAFASILQKRIDGLVVGPHSFFLNRLAQLLTLARAPRGTYDFSLSRLYRSRRIDELWIEPRRISPSRHLYRPHPEGRTTGRSARHAIEQICVRHQPADGESARLAHSADAARSRRRGHRVAAFCCTCSRLLMALFCRSRCLLKCRLLEHKRTRYAHSEFFRC
jgi:putative ABC transport system substrate-binding protein